MRTVDQYIRWALRPRVNEKNLVHKCSQIYNLTEFEVENLLQKIKTESLGNPQENIDKIKREYEFLKKEYDKFKDKRNVVDEIVSLCKANIQPLQVEKRSWEVKQNKEHQEEVAVLMISDTHIGFNINDLEAPNKDMIYNIDVLETRIKWVIGKFLDIIEEKRKTRNIKKLVLPFLGDMVEGNWISINASKDDIVRQIFEGVRIFAQAVQTLSKEFETIEVYCVSGNHGVIQKGQPEYVNWDYIFYRFLEETCRNLSNVSWTVATLPYQIFQVFDYRYCLMHGGNIKMFYKTPYYGIETADINLKSIINQFGDRYDILLLGHFHQPAFLPTQSGMVIMNGSLFGYSPFGLKIRRYYPPNQVCFGIHPDHSRTWFYSLEFKEGRKE